MIIKTWIAVTSAVVVCAGLTAGGSAEAQRAPSSSKGCAYRVQSNSHSKYYGRGTNHGRKAIVVYSHPDKHTPGKSKGHSAGVQVIANGSQYRLTSVTIDATNEDALIKGPKKTIKFDVTQNGKHPRANGYVKRLVVCARKTGGK